MGGFNHSGRIQKIIEQCIIPEKGLWRDGKFYAEDLLGHVDHTAVVGQESLITRLKEMVKRRHGLYYFLVFLISSSYFDTHALITRRRLISNNKIIVNLWSGNKFVSPKVINVDLFDYPNVNIVADLRDLPIRTGFVDVVLNESNIEHVYDYNKVVAEAHRILKPDGTAYFVVPFIFSFHSSPYDFFRFSHIALIRMFQEAGFRDVDVRTYSGPASSFVLMSTEFFATLLSFWIFRLYEIWHIIFTLCLWPIKFFDILLNSFEFSKNGASIFYLIAKK